jgi:hypothetical protein
VNDALSTKLNISDTAAMLSSYAKGDDVNSDLSTKLNIADTSAMLNPYARTSDVNDKLSTKLNISDTAAMLLPYAKGDDVNSDLFTKLNISDTSSMLNPYARTSDVNDALSTKLNISDTAAMLSSYAKGDDVNNNLSTKLNIVDTANMLNPYARTNVVNSNLATKLNISDTATMLSPYYLSSTATTALALKENIANKSSSTGLGSSDILYPTQHAVKRYVDSSFATGLSGSGTTNFLPKFTGTSSFGNSLIFDDGTKVGISTSSPSSLFQVGGESNTDLNLKYDFVANTSAALKLGYRQYQWRIKTNTNSGTLDALIFSYYNGSTDVDRLSISNSGISVTDNLTVSGNISGTDGTLASVNVNNGLLYVDKTNSRVGVSTGAPSSLFQVGGEANTDLNLKYDFVSNTSSALKLGYRQYQWRIKTSTNSGVLLPLVFSYYNGTTDVDMLQVGTTGGLTASSFIKSGGTSSQFLKADGSVDANTYLTSSSASSTFLPLSGGTLTGALSGTTASFTTVSTTGKITTGAITYPNTDGSNGQVLTTNGSGTVSFSYPITDATDEFTATASQTSFTLSHTPSARSKVKMYINGIRISNTAYSVSGTTLTYTASNNGSYSLTANDRIQFDYFY